VENCSWVKLRHPEPHHLERETEHQGLAEVKDSPNETGAEGAEGAEGAADEVKAQELADKPEPTETDCQVSAAAAATAAAAAAAMAASPTERSSPHRLS
jgi:hypothetical protein